jgi:excisionase family DNA binding protein
MPKKQVDINADIRAKDRELAERGYPEAMTSRDVTRLLGISRRTLHDLVKDGQIEAFRIRTQLRYERANVAHYMRVSRASKRWE